ncbi:acyl-CoA thioesterase/BAAT N-terminal domain-containing protein [Paucibacter sp. TC2R-5]|uniref:acyl-CoA thioester hydrolase/BAAT C-terminal domain-containing protein n=1 Tax=Paucibacter sp. TC2R-5 TaxID=2893555 RepID=UPI0021E443D1|nr:acyl-CoA thioester hydrolase/BAAT C-terminal domain-containing protein [Paucibacter sp. TC2R-5]MCV2359888.1 acyl-CoA thioesterase/BAAT N-terminal domain-containing protein [Paucibacter sp. TC2R-5]
MANFKITCIVTAVALSLSLPALAQQIHVSPAAEVVEGTALSLRLSELPPLTSIRIVSSRLARGMGPQQPHQAQAWFTSNAAGELDLAAQAPDRGSYSGADVRGLFWSMQLTAPSAALPPLDPKQQGEVWLQAFAGERLLVEKKLVLRPFAPEVQSRPVADFPGARFCLGPGAHKRGAIIVLGGSEGGSIAARTTAPLLASQGYAVLGLPYYSPPTWGAQGMEPAELPSLPSSFADIELERLNQAREWLARQPEVDAERIAVYGVSKGAEFALAAAARMDWIRAVVAYVPSDVVWEGWGMGVPQADTHSSFAWKGKPLAWQPYKGMAEEMAGFASGTGVHIRRPMDQGRVAHPERLAAARIPVENYAGPLLMIAGGDDQMWDSAGMARNIEASRKALGLPTTSLIYPGAGHGLSASGWAPTTGHNLGPMKLGGSPALDARAQADAWPQMLAFLHQYLAKPMLTSELSR